MSQKQWPSSSDLKTLRLTSTKLQPKSSVKEEAVSEEQDAAAAFFQLSDGLLRVAPGTLLPSDQLPVLIAWAGASLRVRVLTALLLSSCESDLQTPARDGRLLAHAATCKSLCSVIVTACCTAAMTAFASLRASQRACSGWRMQVREPPPVSAALELLTHLVSPASAGIDTSPAYQVRLCAHHW